LYPELDLWQTALPFLEEWQRQRLSPINNLKVLQEKLPEWIEKLPEMPELVYDNLHSHQQYQARLRQQMEQLLAQQEALQRQSNRRWRLAWTLLIITGLGSLILANQ